MRSQLASHFRSVREEQGLGFVELAQIVGYKNITKGCNRIQQFEQRNEVHADLLRKLADALGIDDETVDGLIDEDHRGHVRKWNEWADQPIRPYLVTRLIPAVYLSKKLAEDVTTLGEAERVAAEAARQQKRKVSLVWTRRLSVWFNEKGEMTARTEASPGEANVPHMRLKGRRRSFLF